MKRFFLIACLFLLSRVCSAMSFYTIQIEESAGGPNYLVNGKPLPIEKITKQVSRIASFFGTNGFVRIGVAESLPVAFLFPVLHMLRANGIQSFSIFIPSDRDGDGYGELHESMEAILMIENVLTNGCLEGEYWGYDDDSSRQQSESAPNSSNKHIEHTEVPWHDGCGGE